MDWLVGFGGGGKKERKLRVSLFNLQRVIFLHNGHCKGIATQVDLKTYTIKPIHAN